MSQASFCLLRGLGREAAHWGHFTELLNKQPFVAEIHCIDLPGAGRFNQLTSPLSIKENAEFVLSQLPATDHPRVVLSVSMGSMVALEMARLQPQQLSKVYVMNTSFSNLSPFYHRLQLQALKRFWNIARSKDLKERELECLHMVSQNPQEWNSLSEEFAQVAKERPMRPANFARQLFAAGTYKIGSEPIDVPIEVLVSRGDQMVMPDCSQRLADLWQLPIHQHPTAGHDIAIDDPQWIIDTVAKTL